MSEPDADVLVVGGGGAGLAAAIEAAGLGRSVVLLEKNPALGGSTAWSVGSISVNDSPHQRRRGIRDSADEHFVDLETLAGRYANRDNRALRRLLVDNITETFGWLESLGLVFTGPMEEPPHRHPRMHNVVPSSRAFPARLGRRARALGVDIRLGAQASALHIEDGCVRGAQVQSPGGGTATLRARGGVVLAGGDYSASPALLAELASEATARLAPVNPTATGAGIRLGLAAGARVVNGDIVRGPVLRFVPPPAPSWLTRLPAHPLLARALRGGFERLPQRLVRPFLMRFLTTALGLSPELARAGAVLVNRDAEPYGGAPAGIAAWAAAQPHGMAWVVFDETIARRFNAWPYFVSTAPGVAYAYLDDYRAARRDIYHRGRTVDELAAAAGLPAPALTRALAATSAATHGGAKAPQAPFHALGPVKAYVAFTDGGLAVDTSLRVLGRDDAPIPGLFAAGSNGQGGLLLEGHGHHLGWAFVSGRIAGRNAALSIS